MKTRGNLFIVGSYCRLNVPIGERADYKAAAARLSREHSSGRGGHDEAGTPGPTPYLMEAT
jgi:hypothetical protein